MSPVIRVSDTIYKRLQNLATPFVDNPATVIERLLDYHDGVAEQAEGCEQSEDAEEVNPTRQILDPNDPPDLMHSRVIEARFDETPAKNWNDLVRAAHLVGMRRVKLFEKLKSFSQSNIRQGKHTTEGFHHLEEVDISIQDKDANKCWRNALLLAQQMNMNIAVLLQWRDNEKAAFPGKYAWLGWSPEKDESETVE
jgi:hypothetical protein